MTLYSSEKTLSNIKRDKDIIKKCLQNMMGIFVVRRKKLESHEKVREDKDFVTS